MRSKVVPYSTNPAKHDKWDVYIAAKAARSGFALAILKNYVPDPTGMASPEERASRRESQSGILNFQPQERMSQREFAIQQAEAKFERAKQDADAALRAVQEQRDAVMRTWMLSGDEEQLDEEGKAQGPEYWASPLWLHSPDANSSSSR